MGNRLSVHTHECTRSTERAIERKAERTSASMWKYK